MNQTRGLAERSGGQFLVPLMPTNEEVYLPVHDDETPPAAIAPFLAAFDQAGISYFDLTPPLQASAREGERLFFEVDGHPSAARYRRIADIVLEHLRSNLARYNLTSRKDGRAPDSATN